MARNEEESLTVNQLSSSYMLKIIFSEIEERKYLRIHDKNSVQLS